MMHTRNIHILIFDYTFNLAIEFMHSNPLWCNIPSLTYVLLLLFTELTFLDIQFVVLTTYYSVWIATLHNTFCTTPTSLLGCARLRLQRHGTVLHTILKFGFAGRLDNFSRFVFYEVKCSILFIQIHGFTNSSLEAYAAVVYLRVKNKIGISLMTSKSKVVPMKKRSVPRLELLTCVLLAKLMKEVISSLLSQIMSYEIIW